MAAGSIVIDLLMRTGSFETDTARAEKRIRAFDKAAVQSARAISTAFLGIAGVATAFTAAAVAMVRGLDDIDERAQNLGVSAKDLSSIDITASFSGVDNIDQALNKFNSTLADAKAGGEQAQAVIRALGIDLKGLRAGTVNTTDALRTAADSVARYADGFEKSALVQDAFGSKQAKLIALLNQGGAGLTQFAGASTESIEAARRASAEIDKLSASFTKLKLSIAGFAAQGINLAIDAVKADSVNSASEQLARLEKRIAALKQQIGQRQNPEFLAALNEDLAEANRLADRLRQAQTDRFLSGGRAARGADETRPTAPTTKIDKEAESFLENLRKQVLTLERGEDAMLRQRAAELGVARAADELISRLKVARTFQDSIKQAAEDQAAAFRASDALNAQRTNLDEAAREIEFQTSLIGKQREEVERLTAARDLDRQLLQSLRGLDIRPAEEDRPAGKPSEVTAMIELFKQLRTAILGAVDARQKVLADFDLKTLNFGFSQEIEDLQFATSLIGKTREQVELLTAARGVDRRQAQATLNLTGDALEKENAAYARFRAQVLGAVEDQQRVLEQMRPLIGIAEGAGDAISSSFEDAIVEGKKLSDVLKQLEKDLLRILVRNLVAQPLGESISKAILGLIGGIATGGGGSGEAPGEGGGSFTGRFSTARSEPKLTKTAGLSAAPQVNQSFTFNGGMTQQEARALAAQVKAETLGAVQEARIRDPQYAS